MKKLAFFLGNRAVKQVFETLGYLELGEGELSLRELDRDVDHALADAHLKVLRSCHGRGGRPKHGVPLAGAAQQRGGLPRSS